MYICDIYVYITIININKIFGHIIVKKKTHELKCFKSLFYKNQQQQKQ